MRSDLWPYRGAEPFEARSPIGHEYVGVVEEVGSAVTTVEQPDADLIPSLLTASDVLGTDTMSRHASRQKPAVEFGATDIVTERGAEGVAKIKELTGGLGAHSVIEAVGTQESMLQAIRSTHPGGHVGRYLPQLIDLIWTRQIDLPGRRRLPGDGRT